MTRESSIKKEISIWSSGGRRVYFLGGKGILQQDENPKYAFYAFSDSTEHRGVAAIARAARCRLFRCAYVGYVNPSADEIEALFGSQITPHYPQIEVDTTNGELYPVSSVLGLDDTILRRMQGIGDILEDAARTNWKRDQEIRRTEIKIQRANEGPHVLPPEFND